MVFCRGIREQGSKHRRSRDSGFTLIELLVVISIIALLLSIMMPALGQVKQKGHAIVCQSNLKQIGLAFMLYASDYNDYAMPACDPITETYWWGQVQTDGIDHKAGLIWSYIGSDLKKNGIYECPAQKFGSYILQGKPPTEPDDQKWITSTYGYNGYYLTPAMSGYSQIAHRPWQRLSTIAASDKLIAFADAMLDWDTTGQNPMLQNVPFIDPPYLLSNDGTSWEKNVSPTTSFRHNERTNIFFVDGHSEPMKIETGEYTSPLVNIGSVSDHNGPYYVPDYLQWTKERRRR